jgi:hypothetical protein
MKTPTSKIDILKIGIIVLIGLILFMFCVNIINFVAAKDKAETAVAAELITNKKINKSIAVAIPIQFTSFKKIYFEKQWGVFEHKIKLYGFIEGQNEKEYPFSTIVYVNSITGHADCEAVFYEGK